MRGCRHLSQLQLFVRHPAQSSQDPQQRNPAHQSSVIIGFIHFLFLALRRRNSTLLHHHLVTTTIAAVNDPVTGPVTADLSFYYLPPSSPRLSPICQLDFCLFLLLLYYIVYTAAIFLGTSWPYKLLAQLQAHNHIQRGKTTSGCGRLNHQAQRGYLLRYRGYIPRNADAGSRKLGPGRANKQGRSEVGGSKTGARLNRKRRDRTAGLHTTQHR